MKLKKWDCLPEKFKNTEVKYYYDLLSQKKGYLIGKRLFDIFLSLLLLIMLSPVFFVVSILIKIDSKGPVFFRQERVTQYGEIFKIFKFRTMVNNAEKIGEGITQKNDSRITKVGKFIRKFRIDEFAQLIDILRGKMTFVGARPESVKYVKCYDNPMLSTLLLPAGVTSLASIEYKNEDDLMVSVNDVDNYYVTVILPQKMKMNLNYIENCSFLYDLKVILSTVKSVFFSKE